MRDVQRPRLPGVESWLTGGGYATSGPMLAGGCGACLAFPVVVAGFLYLSQSVATYFGVGFLLALVTVLVRGPHWWAWRACGTQGRRFGLFLGASLWLSPFPPGLEGQGARALAATALVEGRFLWFGVGNGFGLLALALDSARQGNRKRSERILEILRRHRAPTGLTAKVVWRYGAEAVALAHLLRGEASSALAWAGFVRGRGARYLGLIARRRLREAVRFDRLALAWFLSPYRTLRLQIPEPKRVAPLESRKGGEVPVGVRHLQLLDGAVRGTVPAAQLEGLAGRWSARLQGEPKRAWLQRAADLEVPFSLEVAEELELRLHTDLELLGAAAEGDFEGSPGGGLSAALRRGRSEPLREHLETECAPFLGVAGTERPLAPALVELARWFDFREAAESWERLEGPDAFGALWLTSLRYAACNWPADLLREQEDSARLACYVMSRWCADLAARFDDGEIRGINGNLLRSCEEGLWLQLVEEEA